MFSLLLVDSSDGFRNCGAGVGVFLPASPKDAVALAASDGILDGGTGFSANSNCADVGVEGGVFGVSIGIGTIGTTGDGVTSSPSMSNSNVSVSSKSPPDVSTT